MMNEENAQQIYNEIEEIVRRAMRCGHLDMARDWSDDEDGANESFGDAVNNWTYEVMMVVEGEAKASLFLLLALFVHARGANHF